MDQNDYFNIFRASIDLKDKKILEVGGSVPPDLVGASKVRSWTSINPSTKWTPTSPLPSWYDTQVMSVTNMGFENCCFDAVFSSNCFEHVDDVAAGFREIYRVLNTGGVLFTIFGPIWSGPIGHHTWVWNNGVPLTFEDNVIPAWDHLIHTRDELGEVLKEKYGPDVIESILRYVYDCGEINRNYDSYYEREIVQHSFVPIVKYRIKTGHRLSRSKRDTLRQKHAEVRDFRTSGYFWILAKDHWPIWRSIRVYMGTAWELTRHLVEDLARHRRYAIANPHYS
jgi:SAM-dependent methyltransferase